MQKLELNEVINSSPVDEQVSINQNQQPSANLSPADFKLSRETHSMKKTSSIAVIVLFVFAVTAGIATGYGGFKLNKKATVSGGNVEVTAQVPGAAAIKAGDIFGLKDEKTFKDSAEGYLQAGGIGGEGSHVLLREGGKNQTVVLTSSATDLDKFVGMQVKVAGETFKGQKVGWLMDVGRVEVLNTKAEPPAEE